MLPSGAAGIPWKPVLEARSYRGLSDRPFPRAAGQLREHYTRWVSCVTIILFQHTIFRRSFGRANSSGESHCWSGKRTKVAWPCVFSALTTALVAFWSGPIWKKTPLVAVPSNEKLKTSRL